MMINLHSQCTGTVFAKYSTTTVVRQRKQAYIVEGISDNHIRMMNTHTLSFLSHLDKSIKSRSAAACTAPFADVGWRIPHQPWWTQPWPTPLAEPLQTVVSIQT